MLSLALAGKPNAGKSTFFAAATMAEVDVANYPFTTIDPNRGVSHVRTRCPCLDREHRCGNCRSGKRYVPIELVDVAGLVPGAHEGRGLGNQFLDALTDADAVLEIVDASGGTDAEGEPVETGSHDPVGDVDFVEAELELWLADIIERNWETVERRSRSPDFDLEASITDVLTGFGATEAEVAACLRDVTYPDTATDWMREDYAALAAAVRARTLPSLVVANKADTAPEQLLEALLSLEKPVVPATAQGELAVRRGADQGVISYDPGDEHFEIVGDIPADQRTRLERLQETMTTYGGTGVQSALNTATYDLLDHITVYPVQDAGAWTDGHGEMLPDAFLLPQGSTPVDLAYTVHSDIGEGYLHAVDARENRQIGDDHVLEDGDVVKIVSTAR
ncbi:MAG: redox-regulated ATPase YchF [Halobacteriaceae archaeon]